MQMIVKRHIDIDLSIYVLDFTLRKLYPGGGLVSKGVNLSDPYFL